MSRRRVLLAGATGLVGRALLDGLLADESVAAVHSLGRRAPAAAHPKLAAHVVDLRALPALPPVDEVYLALGSTLKAAGGRAAFRAVDHDANLAVAKAALAAGACRAGLVSAVGADPGSRVFYNRVKGELEVALRLLAFQGLVIARPSLLVGDRRTLGQPSRRGEAIGLALARAFGALVPADYRPIEAGAVAAALLRAVPVARGASVLSSGSMR